METVCEAAAGADTIAALIATGANALAAAGVSSARLDAELLLAAACGVDRRALYVRGRDPVGVRAATTFRELLARRTRREPLQYIVGRQEFWSLDFVVTPDVLVPRPETELLVELAIPLAEQSGAAPRICDIGTGSGCIAVALAHEVPRAQLWAVDRSAAALAVAQRNARQHGVDARVRFECSDLFAALAGQRFAVVVANPPYLTASELLALQPEVAGEPRSALDGGADGLAVIRRLIADAPHFLTKGGWLLLEIGASQGAAVELLARAAGFCAVSIRNDYAGLPRVLMARC